MSRLSAAVHVGLRGLERTRRPRLNGRLRVEGLTTAVEILRDTWGVPHIYAQNTHDLLFGQGFVHAQDRLWQMEFQRRIIAGRLAEVLGPTVIPLDRSMRILGLRRVAEQEVRLLSPEMHAMITAYAAGINACIASQPLPIEFTLLRYRPEPWTPADSLSWAKMMAWSLSINWETELLRARLMEALGPERAAELESPWPAHWPIVVPPARAGAAPHPSTGGTPRSAVSRPPAQDAGAAPSEHPERSPHPQMRTESKDTATHPSTGGTPRSAVDRSPAQDAGDAPSEHPEHPERSPHPQMRTESKDAATHPSTGGTPRSAVDRSPAQDAGDAPSEHPERSPHPQMRTESKDVALPEDTGPFTVGGSHVGSNNWVVAGRRTQSGMPLLANDMHLLLSAPAIWHENHLVADADGLNVTGVSFPGIPLIVAGHNGRVAWGFTNGFPDVQDLYIERVRATADGGAEYEYCGAWHPADVRREVIQVKGAAPVEQTVICTRHGPIINELAPGLAAAPWSGAAGEVALPDVPLALHWTALEPNTMVDALYGMNRAQTCLELREALRGWETPTQNTVYADTEGNIGYSFAGHVPIRKAGDGSVPVPGWTDEYEWQGYIPFDELPHLYNPPQGFVVSANNRPVDESYPHFLGREFEVGDRAQRIVELLAAHPKADVATFRGMHFDSISPSMQLIAGYLGQLAADEPELRQMIECVRGWDGDLAADSPAAAICEVFLREFARAVLEPKLTASPDNTPSLLERVMGRGPTPFIQEGSFFAEQTWMWALDLLTARESHWYNLGGGETRDDVLRLALRRTMARLTEWLGPPDGPEMSNWAWGRLHTLTFGHPVGAVAALGQHFNRGPYPAPGDGNTVWATGSGITPESSRSAVGPPFRFIADLGDLRNSIGLLAPGNSGCPDSPHYDDQIEAWFKGEYHPLLYAREDVEAGAKMRLWLENGRPGG